MKKIFIITTSVIIVFGCTQKNIPHEHAAGTVGYNVDSPAIVLLNEHQQFVANITIDTVRAGTIDETVTMLGTTAVNENGNAVISSRVSGRIDFLSARNPGEYIFKGQPLYSIYSEELLAAQKEYLMAVELTKQTEPTNVSKLAQSARRKLLLLGMKDDQISNLENGNKLSNVVTFFSDHNGILTDLMVSEGQYVQTGSPLFSITDLTQVWVETQLYANEIVYLNKGANVFVEFPHIPGGQFKATLAFQNPVIDPDTKINNVRFKLRNNERHMIKPGEMAYIHLSKGSKKALIVPRSAIVYESTPAVWVKVSPGVFEKRMVKLGMQNKQAVEIVAGLSQGDLVAATGGYLINSEYILRKGAGSMGVMKM